MAKVRNLRVRAHYRQCVDDYAEIRGISTGSAAAELLAIGAWGLDVMGRAASGCALALRAARPPEDFDISPEWQQVQPMRTARAAADAVARLSRTQSSAAAAAQLIDRALAQVLSRDTTALDEWGDTVRLSRHHVAQLSESEDGCWCVEWGALGGGGYVQLSEWRTREESQCVLEAIFDALVARRAIDLVAIMAKLEEVPADD